METTIEELGLRAGRSLVHARLLASEVSDKAHQKVLELLQLKYRGFFANCLDEKTPAFFYGSDDDSIDADEAARQSTAPEDRAGRRVTSTLKSLSEKSIHAVWEAAQWPSEYEDPLDRDFSPAERGKLIVLNRGLHEFLEHRDRFDSASGKLFERNQTDAS